MGVLTVILLISLISKIKRKTEDDFLSCKEMKGRATRQNRICFHVSHPSSVCRESRNSASDLELSQPSAHVDHSNQMAALRRKPHRELLWLWTHLLPRCAFQNTGARIHQDWLSCLSSPELPNIYCFMVSSNYLV